MKKHLVVLAGLVGFVAPIALQAGPSDSATPANTHGKKVATEQAKPSKEHRTYYYITDKVVTGSFIPVVIRRDGTDTSSMSVVSNYTRQDLDRTGSEDVAGELVKIDPAIMLRNH